jgi:hypothetical protein
MACILFNHLPGLSISTLVDLSLDSRVSDIQHSHSFPGNLWADNPMFSRGVAQHQSRFAEMPLARL